MQPTRRALFNPTSLPGLRAPRPRWEFYRQQQRVAAGNFGRVGAGLRWGGIRRETTQAGEDKSGHINALPNEGILFVDNLYPQKLNWLLRLPWRGDPTVPGVLKRFDNSAMVQQYDPKNLVKKATPETLPMKVTEILPRWKDGGAYVKFQHAEGVTAQEIEDTITKYLKDNPIKPWFNPLARIRANLVVGKPWLEDLFRPPSTRVKVEFVPPSPGGEAAELSQETLFTIFRKYGRLAEITPQPSDSKILPKYAYLDFAKLRNAIMAKNCVHGFQVDEVAGGGKLGTVLRLSFEQKQKIHWIWNWLASHPRVVIPAVAALVTTITIAIFDPIRTFFIRTHIEHSFRFKDNKIWRWLLSQARDVFAQFKHRQEDVSLDAIWDDRRHVIDQMQTWLLESADTFIVVQGPRGSGKKELIMDQALKGRKDVLLIDCKPIQEARGDSATITAAAKAVGYRPVFSWMNSLTSLIDLAAQGTIGVKSGFSETLDAQLQKIWQNTAKALQQVALSNRNKNDKDAGLSDDDWLEAHAEYRPVVVIDNFLHKNEEASIVYDKLSEWAASLSQANVAHVIFLTDDISYSKSLAKALPDRVFRQIALGDISPEVAKRFVQSHLEQDQKSVTGSEVPLTEGQKQQDTAELDDVIYTLGGRLTDLEFLARRLKSGQTPKEAVAEIIEQSASELIKMYILKDQGTRKWSQEQAWYLIKALAAKDDLRFNEVLLSNTFSSSLTPSASSGEAALEALTGAELISITSYMGRPQSIRAGKPVYQAAFKLITQDKVLSSRLDLAILTELTKVETKSIDKYEQELNLLANLPKQPREISPRIEFVLAKLAASQAKVEAWEQEMGKLKKVLTVEY